MRLYAPQYEGNSFLRPDAALGEPAITVFKTPVPAADFVRSNIQMGTATGTALLLHAIEHAARWLKAAYTAVADWLERVETWERDKFFAEAQNLCDLEARQRHWERTGRAHY